MSKRGSKRHALTDVFGLTRARLPATYVARSYVDDEFVNSLGRERHVVLFGRSKQGKTCLRWNCLKEEDSVVVQCRDKTTAAQLYANILKEAGATISVAQTKSMSGEQKITVDFTATAGLPLVGKASAEGGYERGSSKENIEERRHFEIDPGDPNDVIRILKSVDFSQFIILEDFHYLDEEVQRQIAMDLKAFHEKSKLCFIVVGVWLEANRLLLYNGDLGDRLVTIDVDRWERGDLDTVIKTGERLLNVRFEDAVRNELIDVTGGNVGVLQETCYALCEANGITGTLSEPTSVGTRDQVRQIVAALAKAKAGRFENFLNDFASGFMNKELELYRWIALLLVQASTSDLQEGLRADQILDRLNKVYPAKNRLAPKELAQTLKKVTALQQRKKIRPPVLDFDVNQQTLRVVDPWFPVYIANTSEDHLRNQLGVSQVSG